MLDTLRKMLKNSNLVVDDIQGIYLIRSVNDVYAENHIEIELRRFKHAITECSRASQKTHFHTKDKNWACALGVMLAKKLYENVIDRSVVDTIMTYIQEDKQSEVVNILTSKGLGCYYQIGTELYNKVSLIIHDDTADVKFGREYIVKNASIARGYVVLYNYASMLRYFNNYFETTLNKFIGTDKYFELAKVYLLSL